jgi:hypothetical protein
MNDFKEKFEYQKERETVISILKKNSHAEFTTKELINALNLRYKKKYTEEQLIIITESKINCKNNSIRYEDIAFLEGDSIDFRKLKKEFVNFLLYLKDIDGFNGYHIALGLIGILFLVSIELGLITCFIILFTLKLENEKNVKIESNIVTFTLIYASTYFLIFNLDNIMNIEIIKKILNNSSLKIELIDNRIFLSYFNTICLFISLFIYFFCQFVRYSNSPRIYSIIILMIPIFPLMIFCILASIDTAQEFMKSIITYEEYEKYKKYNIYKDPSKKGEYDFLIWNIMLYSLAVICGTLLLSFFSGLLARNLMDEKFKEVLYILILMFISIIFTIKYDKLINNYYDSKQSKNDSYCKNIDNDIKIIRDSNHKFKILIDRQNIDDMIVGKDKKILDALADQKNNRFIYFECK